jgi:hypothetical protein
MDLLRNIGWFICDVAKYPLKQMALTVLCFDDNNFAYHDSDCCVE